MKQHSASFKTVSKWNLHLNSKLQKLSMMMSIRKKWWALCTSQRTTSGLTLKLEVDEAIDKGGGSGTLKVGLSTSREAAMKAKLHSK